MDAPLQQKCRLPVALVVLELLTTPEMPCRVLALEMMTRRD